MNTGEQLVGYVEEAWKLHEEHPIILVETGCLRRIHDTAEADDGWSTLYLAKWVEAHPESKFFSVDINIKHINVAGSVLAKNGIKPAFPMFTCGESVEFLKGFGGPIDFAYLDTSDGWEHGLAEFEAAESKGARIIVMDDYISKAVLAAKYAKDHEWDVKQEGRFTVMRR